MIKHTAFTLILLPALFSAAALSGAVLLSDGFESAAVDSDIVADSRVPDIDNTGASAAWSGSHGSQMPLVTLDGEDKVIELTKLGGTRAFSLGAFPPLATGQVSLDFRFIQDGLNGGVLKDVFNIEVSPDTPDLAGNQQSSQLGRAALGMDLLTWETATLIFNGTDSPISYSNGDYTVAAQSADLWIGDVLFRDDVARATDGSGNYAYVGIRIFKYDTTDPLIVQFDDFVLEDTISFVGPVPTATWAGFDIDENGIVNTGTLMGLIFVSGDWVWSYDLERWLYLPEALVVEAGAWTYVNK